jgi:uncharacterized tellurite resistance protein B-like protein
MMFDRLLGHIDNNNAATQNLRDPDGDIRLSAAILLFSMVPADYQNLPEEGTVLLQQICKLLNLGQRRGHKLIARAAAAKDAEPSIFAAANILKRKTSIEFRQKILHAIDLIALADGVVQVQEVDLAARTKRLLNIEQNAENAEAA